ncbi:MAG TPA: hypothetical protein VMF03_02200 [Steroidobacteraceae bacterium]|nr:hypothetical protein [Steroidobacteraceae bacterium]
MTLRNTLTLAAAAITMGVCSVPAHADDSRRNFVTCPILQDTTTVPCWMADYGGERYFLGIQTDSGGWSPPYLGHKVLVEGRVVPGPRICGGIPLTSDYPQSPLPSGSADGSPLPNPPVISPMRELDPSCNAMLPADPRYHIEGRRGPGPNTAASALRPPPGPAPVSTPSPPFQVRTFTLTYDFDSEVAGKTIGKALEAVQYARAIGAHRMLVLGYRGATLLSDGTVVAEIPDIGELRVHQLAAAIRKLGIPAATTLTLGSSTDPEHADGITDPARRRTEITVTP